MMDLQVRCYRRAGPGARAAWLGLGFGLSLTLTLAMTLILTTDPNPNPDPNPNQVLGPPADIYSLGVILFELLSGKG